MYVEARERLVDWLEKQLIGPATESANGADHELDMSPLDRYPVGVLHPLESEQRGVDPASESGTGDDDDDEGPGRLAVGDGAGLLWGEEDDGLLDAEEEESLADGEPGASSEKAAPVRRRRYVPPSSVGFSFCVRGDVRLRVEASAAVYAQSRADFRDDRGQFTRRYARTELDPDSVSFSLNGESLQRREIWLDAGAEDGGNRSKPPAAARAGLDVRVRRHESGKIVTVTLFNCRRLERGLDGRQPVVERVERSLFEARLECFVEEGEIVDYPRVDLALLTDEERELELQYRERRIFAVGHGAAADWKVVDGEPARIRSDFLPRAETPIVRVEPRGVAEVLEMERLAGDELPLGLLRAFVGEYAAWVRERLIDAAREEEEEDHDAAARITDRMKVAHERMLGGVDMLGGDPDAALAFRLANRAMLRQMVRFRGERDEPWSWRPFQLGFLLATIESTVDEQDDYRDILDLIWFQTGGGKTEAYLGLIAFLLVWRRLRYGGQGGGTAAFMRYTLRLLTRQQFERAAGLICALELLRREDEEGGGRLGREPFSVGIWVGGAVCPNRVQDAAGKLDEIRAAGDSGEAAEKARNGLLLTRCPWCLKPFESERGYEAIYPDFRFHCHDPECEFGRNDDPLPCRVIDESLYSHPPSLLIATIDKFARLAWEERAGAFFGASRNQRAPDLVLQDELHLISGPLGSVAGLYEAGIETVIRCRGVKPKYIASTATIRMAREQVRALYGRDVAVFPPPGLSADDSWFARVDRAKPGRLYLGYLAPLKDQQHSLAPLAASLVAAPLVVFRGETDAEDLFEAWWTSVLYHGSLRGVGTSSNAYESDVREFGQRLIAEYVEKRGAGGQDEEEETESAEGDPIEQELRRRFGETQFAQLWSRHTAEEIAETFERLGEVRGSERCLDAVLSTNMVSVGLDVSRLALMIVNGQPLTTGEYVQATSRVGRGEAPGLVVANYYRHQARSLSHYESFRPYHESFYRFVEPSSVTPFTFQVCKRALHAALVIALRHACDDLAPNHAARCFDAGRPSVRRIATALRRRVERACPEKSPEVDERIDRLLAEWHDTAAQCREGAKGLHYRSSDKANDRLLYSHEDRLRAPGLWPTLNSMRNVESPAVLGMG